MQAKPLDYLEVSALGAWLAFLEDGRYPLAREQLFGSTRSQVRILSPRLTFQGLEVEQGPQMGPQLTPPP